MKGMSQALHFGKSVHDNGWGMFTTFLSYKLKEQGKQLVKIDKWFPSTKKCSWCGAEKPMKLSEHIYAYATYKGQTDLAGTNIFVISVYQSHLFQLTSQWSGGQ